MVQSATDEIRLIRYPDIHGDKVAFVYASDIWVAGRQGGLARRLTSHRGMESNPKFSPDGKWIAFNGQYDGSNDIYVIPSDGGEPRRLTFEPGGETMKDWTPDGKKIAYVTNTGFTNRMPQMWLVPVEGGQPQKTNLQETYDLSFSPDGKKLAFTRANSHLFNWRRYRGGTQGRIAFWDFDNATYSEIPTGREQNYFPMWVGDKVYFISDKNQTTLNLYVYETGSKKVTQLTKFSDGDIRWPSTDGKTIVFERNLRLHTYDLATGEMKTLDPRVTGDNLAMRPRFVSVENDIESIALSPSGKRLAVVARGDVFSLPASSGSTRNQTESSGSRESLVEWTPDGQFMLYLSDKSGEDRLVKQPQMGGKEEVIPIPASHKITGFNHAPKGDLIAYTTTDFSLWVFDPATGQSTKVVTDQYQRPGIEWSPDGKWLAYLRTQPNLVTAICLYDVTAKKEHKVTAGMFGDSSVSFDLSGKYLYYVSGRTYGVNFSATDGPGLHQEDISRVYMMTLAKDTPNPLEAEEDEEPVKSSGESGSAEQAKPAEGMKVDIEGMEARTLTLPYPPGAYGVIGLRDSVIVASRTGETTIFSLKSRRPAPFVPATGAFSLNADRTKAAIQTQSGLSIVDVRPGVDPNSGRVNTGGLGMMVDPRAEFRQMFWDVWRFQRDQFYQENMMGLDWKAIGDKYAAMLPFVGDRSDLDYIFGQLIGELGTGHAYVTPGPAGSDPMNRSGALLGADYIVVGDKIQFKKIYRGVSYDPATTGPLGALGVDVKDGEYLLAIDGKPVTAKTGVTEHLLGKAGQRVTLTVNSSPSMTGSREITVRPTSSETSLRYHTWVEERRQMVDQLSGGRIGYMHVPDTNFQGILMFMRGWVSQYGKEAWVIDERYNGGGFIPTFFIEYLSRTVTNTFAPRHGNDVGLPTALEGPKAMLINEYAGSGGDLFPYLFKKAGLGPLIGTRTWGGLVGIQGSHGLMGGGAVTSPGFGLYDPHTGKWIAENTGVDPDIAVDDRPDWAAQGKDAQLEKAVEYLMKELAKPRPQHKKPGLPKLGDGLN